MEKSRHDVFLCYNKQDRPSVLQIARFLKENGIEPWLDEWNQIPGEPWQEAIERGLLGCAACAVFLGPDGTGPWQDEEIRTAINRQISEGELRVIPVLLPGTERGYRSRLPAFLVRRQWVELQSLEDTEGLRRLIAGIRGVEPGPGPGEEIAPGVCPYRGLQFFDVEDSHLFFGREALIGWLLEKLRRSPVRFLALVGASGSGKSSLARAGLLGALRRGELPGSETWPLAVLRPGADPLENLLLAVNQALNLDSSVSKLGELIQNSKDEPRTLHRMTRLAMRDAPPERRLVVLIDQFEEIFTQGADETARQALIANILEATTAPQGQVIAFLTIRSDFLGACADHPGLAALLSDHQELVGPMDRQELLRAIECPAQLAGCNLDPGLPQLLLKEVEKEPGGLPLLQHVLLLLWECRQGHYLTVVAYQQLGQLRGALDNYAEQVYESLAERERITGRRVFLRLVVPGPGSEVAKQRLKFEELVTVDMAAGEEEALETVLQKLAEARLLTLEAQVGSGIPTVEPAHEALLQNWIRLAGWIEEDRHYLRSRRKLGEAAREWDDNGRQTSYLLRENRLAETEEWVQQHAGDLNRIEQEFLDESRVAFQAEKRRERNRIRRLRRLTVVLATAFGLALAAAFLAWASWRKSEARHHLRMAAELGGKASALLTENPVLSMLLAVEALRRVELGEETRLPVVDQAFRDALSRIGGKPLGDTRITASALSSNQRWLVTAGEDGRVHRWDLSAPNPTDTKMLLVSRPKEPVAAVAVSNDGRWVLTQDSRGKARLQITTGPGIQRDIGFHHWAKNPFSPDSRWLVTQHGKRVGDHLEGDGLTVQNLAAGVRTPLKGYSGAWAFSPDSSRLAVISYTFIDIWSLQATLPAPEGIRLTNPNKDPFALLLDVEFSSDGQRVLADEDSQSLLLWRLNSKTHWGSPLRLTDCNGHFAGFALSGKWVSAWTWGGDACLWQLKIDNTSAQVRQFREVNRIALHSGSSRIAIARSDGSIRVESLDEESGSGQRRFWGPTPLSKLSFASGGRWLVAQGSKEAPRLLSLAQGKYNAGSLAITPNGQRSVVGLGEKRWIRDSRRLRYVPGRFPISIDGMAFPAKPTATLKLPAFSQDGSLMLINDIDGKLRLVEIPSEGPTSSRVLSVNLGGATARSEISVDNRWLALGYGTGEVWLIDLRDRTSQRIHEAAHAISELTLHPKGPLVAFADEGGDVQLLDVAKSTRRAIVDQQVFASSLRLSPTGKWLAVADEDGRIDLWRTEGGGRVQLLGLKEPVSQFAFSSDEEWLACVDLLGSVRIWNLRLHRPGGTGLRLQHLHQTWYPSFDGGMDQLLFSKVDNSLSLFTLRHPPLHWELRSERLIPQACQAAGRNLTRQEWETYLPNEPFRPRSPCPELPEAPGVAEGFR